MKTRVAVCGAELAGAAAALGLDGADGAPDLVLVDLRDPVAVARAALLPRDIPRVVVADSARRDLALALGIPASGIADSADPAALGPAIAAALPKAARRATRVVLVSGVRGGVGRTLLVVNLALRLARTLSVVALDATGTGGLGWWLRAPARSWSELEGLVAELSPEHLAVVAEEPTPGVRVIGGAPAMPSVALTSAAASAAQELGDVVLVDAPPLADERTRALFARVDRTLVLCYTDPASLAGLDAAALPEDPWLIASQTTARVIGGREVFRALPRDDAAVAAAMTKRARAGGALGRAFDELAELLADDAT